MSTETPFRPEDGYDLLNVQAAAFDEDTSRAVAEIDKLRTALLEVLAHATPTPQGWTVQMTAKIHAALCDLVNPEGREEPK